MSKHWANIFRVLSNINRIKIIAMLSGGKNMSVTEIADKLLISLKSTSKHLIILENFGVLESDGKRGHVFYSLNKNLPADFDRAIKLFC